VSDSSATVERESVRWPVFANVIYPRFRRAAKKHGEDRYRHTLLDGLEGRVLEVGCGDGANFELYPNSVTELVGIEPEENLRRRAEQAAAKARVPTRVMAGFAEALPAKDAEFDAAVTALVLCSVRDQRAALRELMRIIRPGGELRVFEHVRADGRLHAALQRAVEPGWSRVGAGCHPSRDTEQAIRDAGFEIQHCEKFDFSAGLIQQLANPHILAVARRP
jgi:SAM-dependent methyltransferase